MYFRLIKVNFPFIKGEGKRRKLSFPSTVDNFWYTFRSPQYSFIASYDAKKELKMDEINSLPKFLSPLISFICGKDTISVPGIVCSTTWGSFLVYGSFAVQFGDHLRYWDHLWARIICGAVQGYPQCSPSWFHVNSVISSSQ